MVQAAGCWADVPEQALQISDQGKGAEGYGSTNAKGNTSTQVYGRVKKNKRTGCHDRRRAAVLLRGVHRRGTSRHFTLSQQLTSTCASAGRRNPRFRPDYNSRTQRNPLLNFTYTQPPKHLRQELGTSAAYQESDSYHYTIDAATSP